MRCKGCQYPLWNLEARVCPECGKPFTPSEFEFVANSVRFCCPDCKQDYYGTGPRGHLVPSAFDCVRCHRHLTMDEMVLLPTEGVQEEQTRTDTMPWLERERIGRIKAWFQTILRALFEPTRLAKATPADSSPLQALWFAILTNGLYSVCAFGPLAVFLMIAMALPRGAPAGASIAVLLVIPIVLVSAVVTYAIALPIWAGVVHLLLLLTGKTASGYSATLRSLAYASGANIMNAIPCIGAYLGVISWIWIGASAAFMLRASQRVSALRAFLAVFVLPVLLMVGLITVWAVTISSALRTATFQANATAASPSAISQGQARQILKGVFAYYDRGDKFPDHAIRLVHENELSAYAFANDPSTVQVGPTNLANFILLASPDAKSLVEAMARKLPADVTAHRLGNYVFTYHGVDPNADPGLWIVVEWPPAQAPTGSATFSVVLADRSVHSFPATSVLTLLAEQNTLRAAKNLSPLPDLDTITPTDPATASSLSNPTPAPANPSNP